MSPRTRQDGTTRQYGDTEGQSSPRSSQAATFCKLVFPYLLLFRPHKHFHYPNEYHLGLVVLKCAHIGPRCGQAVKNKIQGEIASLHAACTFQKGLSWFIKSRCPRSVQTTREFCSAELGTSSSTEALPPADVTMTENVNDNGLEMNLFRELMTKQVEDSLDSVAL